MKKVLHVCLVSRQPMPNIIPVFLKKPSEVILLTTKEEENTAVNIINVLSKNDYKCSIYPYKISAYNLDTITEALNILIDKYKTFDIIMNFTGGTKLMVIAAYEVFRNRNFEMIYCDTHESKIMKFRDGRFIAEDFSSAFITINDYLSAYGYEQNLNQNKAEKYEGLELVEFINKNLDAFISFSSELRKKIQKCNLNFELNIEDFQLEKKFDRMSLFYKNIEILNTEFKNVNYLIGGWLEDFLFDYLSKLNLDDIKKGYYIKSKSGSENEIDLLFINNCKLYLLSCKTGNFDKKDLFELEGLRNLTGGTFSHAYIIVMKKDKNYNNLKERANDMKIKLMTIKEFMKEKF